MRTLFITGTGTDVGKTLVTCLLGKQLANEGKKTQLIKPIESGYNPENEGDIIRLLRAMNREVSAEAIAEISLYRLRAPFSPDMAARREGVTLDYRNILEFCRRERAVGQLLIEGAGGVMTPVAQCHTVLDLIADLGAPALLVAGTYLGAISHTLTALAALAHRSIPVSGVVVSESSGAENPSLEDTIITLKNFTDADMMALPRLSGEGDENAPELVQWLRLVCEGI